MQHFAPKFDERVKPNIYPYVNQIFKHALTSYLQQLAFCQKISAGLTLNFSAVVINFSSRAETLVNNSAGRECKDRARERSPVAFVLGSWMLLKVCYLLYTREINCV